MQEQIHRNGCGQLLGTSPFESECFTHVAHYRSYKLKNVEYVFPSKHVDSNQAHIHIYSKNARLHSDEKFAELLGEMQHCKWILFANTVIQNVNLLLFCVNSAAVVKQRVVPKRDDV